MKIKITMNKLNSLVKIFLFTVLMVMACNAHAEYYLAYGTPYVGYIYGCGCGCHYCHHYPHFRHVRHFHHYRHRGCHYRTYVPAGGSGEEQEYEWVGDP
jgi:hypothetical protein